MASLARQRKEGDVHLLAVHAEVPVAHQLAGLGVIGGEAQPIDHVVQAALQHLQEVLAGDPLHADGLEVVATELPLGEAVDALHLLLLAQLQAVVGDLAPAGLAVLTRGVRAPLVAALVGVAAVALQEELHVFAPAKAANRTGVFRHGSGTYSFVRPDAAWAGGSRCEGWGSDRG
jgi:hypothetical protein